MNPQENNLPVKPFPFSDIPLGVKIIGIFNFIVTGILALLLFAVVFSNPGKLSELIKNLGGDKMLEGKFTIQQLRMLILPQAGIALFYIVTAAGVLFRREWARKALVYFSFALAVFMVLGVFAQPAAIMQIMGQAVHPGVMIYYFTGKSVVEWFAAKPLKE
jgi:hypothetical protein